MDFKLVEPLLQTHSCFFSQSTNICGLPLSACHCLTALPAKMCAFKSIIQQNACYHNLKWTFAGVLPRYCYAIKTNNRTIHSRLSLPPSARKGRDISNCKSITAWHYNCEPDSCAMWVSYKQKLSLQESNQLIGIKMPTSAFSRNFWFLISISRGGKCPFSRTSVQSLTILYQVSRTRSAHLMNRRNVFE